MRFFTWIAKAADEDTGEPSALRLVVLYGLGSIITLWTATSVWHHALQDIPGGVQVFAGTLLGAKCVQKFGENKTP